jgi:hypothetical protein
VWFYLVYLLPSFPTLPSGLQIPKRYSTQFSFSVSRCCFRLFVFCSRASFNRSFNRLRSSASSCDLSVSLTHTAATIKSSLLSILSKKNLFDALDSWASFTISMKFLSISLSLFPRVSKSSVGLWALYKSIRRAQIS